MEAEYTVKFSIYLSDSDLSVAERDREVEQLFDQMQGLEGLGVTSYIVDPLSEKVHSSHHARVGIAAHEVDADRIRPMMQFLGDRLAQNPIQLRVVLQVGYATLQIKTNNSAAFLSTIPAAEKLSPANLTYQSRAEYYARQGEIVPAAQANLDLLQYQLGLSSDAASAIVAKALGPYQSRQDKLQKYREVLAAEYDRNYSLSEETRAELKRLYEGLGLTYNDIASINEEFIGRSEVREAEDRAAQLQDQITQLQERTRLQQEAQARVALENRTQYQQEFRQVIQGGLFPSEFDRGRLEQARRIWNIPQAESQAIEKEITDQEYGDISSAKGIDYSRLRYLLWMNNWAEADQETERAILSAASYDMKPMQPDLINQVPCTDLLTIDELWKKYSRGQFGFSAQWQVFENANQNADEFLRQLEWQGAWGGVIKVTRPYSELQFSQNAPLGHLPTWRWACGVLESGYTISPDIVDSVFRLMEMCLPSSRPASIVQEPVIEGG